MQSSNRSPRPLSSSKLDKAWRDFNALRLNDAWFILGDPDHKEQYENAGRRQRLSAYLMITMQRDLLGRLADHELLSIGVRVAPTLGDGPEILPSFVFHNPSVDWKESRISAYGRVFEDVRVVHPKRDKAIRSSLT